MFLPETPCTLFPSVKQAYLVVKLNFLMEGKNIWFIVIQQFFLVAFTQVGSLSAIEGRLPSVRGPCDYRSADFVAIRCVYSSTNTTRSHTNLLVHRLLIPDLRPAYLQGAFSFHCRACGAQGASQVFQCLFLNL